MELENLSFSEFKEELFKHLEKYKQDNLFHEQDKKDKVINQENYSTFESLTPLVLPLIEHHKIKVKIRGTNLLQFLIKKNSNQCIQSYQDYIFLSLEQALSFREHELMVKLLPTLLDFISKTISENPKDDKYDRIIDEFSRAVQYCNDKQVLILWVDTITNLIQILEIYFTKYLSIIFDCLSTLLFPPNLNLRISCLNLMDKIIKYLWIRVPVHVKFFVENLLSTYKDTNVGSSSFNDQHKKIQNLIIELLSNIKYLCINFDQNIIKEDINKKKSIQEYEKYFKKYSEDKIIIELKEKIEKNMNNS